MKITGKTKICMVIGDPVEHSLSPILHNAGFEALGIDFVDIACHVKVGDLENFIRGFRAMSIRGSSVTIPHKLEIMKYMDDIEQTAKKIGAVNTVVNNNGFLVGTNTDWIGVISPLEKITSVKNKKAAVLGAGGAARSAIYGLSRNGATVTIYNRTLEKANQLAKEFGAQARSIEDLSELKSMDILVNATSVGLDTDEKLSPLDLVNISQKQIVIDFVYNSNGPTKLISDAKQKGAKTISGTDIVLAQGVVQFKLFTGFDAPEEAMRKALLKYMGEKLI